MLCWHPPSSTGVNSEGTEQDVRGGWPTAKLARPTGIVQGPPRTEARKDAECRHKSLCVPSRYQLHPSPPKPRKHLQLNSHRLSTGLHRWRGPLSLKALTSQEACRAHSQHLGRDSHLPFPRHDQRKVKLFQRQPCPGLKTGSGNKWSTPNNKHQIPSCPCPCEQN